MTNPNIRQQSDRHPNLWWVVWDKKNKRVALEGSASDYAGAAEWWADGNPNYVVVRIEVPL